MIRGGTPKPNKKLLGPFHRAQFPVYQKRNLEDLLNLKEPAWPMVQEWIGRAENDVQVLEPRPTLRENALVASQVTTRSPLGAIIFETGGLLIDHGWLRVLGSGSPRLPRPIHLWNEGRGFKEFGVQPGLFLVADDPLGGFFAMNGGALGEDFGNVYYHAPDTLQWEPLDVGYSAFIQWAFTSKLGEWSSSLRWSGWQTELSRLTGDQGILVTPPLIAEGPPIEERHRGVVPIAELFQIYVDADAPTDSDDRLDS